MARMKSAEGQKRGRRLRFHELSHENDIRYRGPLSYREFMILGWLGIICGRIVTVQNLMFRFNSDLIPVLQSQHAVLDGISSLSLAFLLIVYSLFGTEIDASKTAMDSEELLMPLMEYNMSVGSAVGFGETVPLAILAPLVLLFSYTRTRKDEVIGRWLIAPVDTLIPVIAIIIIVFVYVEGIHQTILVSHLPRFDLTEAAKTMQETMSELIMPE